MQSLLEQIYSNISKLGLTYIDENHTLNILKIAFNSTFDFINLNFAPSFDFNSIEHIISDITIGEYLLLIKNSDLGNRLNFQDSVKAISEGEVSLTYFEGQSNQVKLDLLIDHFLGKKKELLAFKAVCW